MTLLLAVLPLLAQPETVTYKSEPRDLVFYLHDATPKAERAGLKRPAAVFFHGGAWINGNPNQFEGRILLSYPKVIFIVIMRLLVV